MKRKRNIILIMLIVIIIIIAVMIWMYQKEKTIKCSSLNTNISLVFKNNKLRYVKGTIDLDSGVSEYDLMFDNNIKYNKKKNRIEFAIPYEKENEGALGYIGFNYNNSSKYKNVIKNLEDNNYYCK